MGKVLLWVVVIIGVMLLTRILTHHNAKSKMRSQGRSDGAHAVPGGTEAMVRCAHCSVHLPRSEAVLSGGRTWCCTEHARLGPGA